MAVIHFDDRGRDVKVMYFVGLGRKKMHVRSAHVPKDDTAALAAEIDATLTKLREERSLVGKVDR